MKISEIIKDLIISILIVICIAVVLSVIFYDDISLSKVIPESEEYLLSDKMQEEIDDTNLEEIDVVVTKYYIDATDLKKYEQTKEYNKGKKNPFAVEETPTTSDTTNTDNNNNTSSDTTDNESENFYEDDGTK